MTSTRLMSDHTSRIQPRVELRGDVDRSLTTEPSILGLDKYPCTHQLIVRMVFTTIYWQYSTQYAIHTRYCTAHHKVKIFNCTIRYGTTLAANHSQG